MLVRKNVAVSLWLPWVMCFVAKPTMAETPSTAKEHMSFDAYISLRMQAESVFPDNQVMINDYRGLRDAYSRVGANMRYKMMDDVTLFGQIELPIDTVNFRLTDPYDQGSRGGREKYEDLRIARVGMTTPIGQVVFGQQWMPYYNAIVTPVDKFSTYYSGFATSTVFRVKDTWAYYSPEIKGVSVAASYSPSAANQRSTSRIDDRRLQATVSYQRDNTRLAFGVDDRGSSGGDKERLYGISVAWTMDNWDLAFKYERVENTLANGFYNDGANAYSVYTGYQQGKNTYKALLVNIESYGEMIVQLGIDHQYNDNLTIFAEFYQEQESAAITAKHLGMDDIDSRSSGGKVFAAGFRYDFSF